MMGTISMTRRRSLNLTVAIKETDRTSTLVPIAKHQYPWNKYLKELPAANTRKSITLSNPTKEEFRRIRQWSIDRKLHEEQQMQSTRRKEAIIQQRQRIMREKSIQERHSRLLQEVQQRQEKRARMKEERDEAQKQYILVRLHSRQIPLLHETMPVEFENALRRMEETKQELYNENIKPFRTVRPFEIISTNILQQMGKFPGENQIVAPFELKRPSLNTATSQRWKSWRRVTDSDTKQNQSGVVLPPIQTPIQKSSENTKTVTNKMSDVRIPSMTNAIPTQTTTSNNPVSVVNKFEEVQHREKPKDQPELQQNLETTEMTSEPTDSTTQQVVPNEEEKTEEDGVSSNDDSQLMADENDEL